MKIKLLLLLCLFGIPAFAQKINYDEQWKKIDSFDNAGLPQSALEIANFIYKNAKAENNAPQLVKSVVARLKYSSNFEENAQEKNIQMLQQEIAASAFPVSNILHSMLAEVYWNYYQDNRYQIFNRSVTVNFNSEDVKTWDLQKIVVAVITEYQLSLQKPAELQKISLKLYDPILEKQENSKKYRPTLYDFLAHRAADCFMNDEAGLTQPAYKFEIANADFFKPVTDFINLKITTRDTLSLKFQAMQIFQEILRFHLNDADPTALVDADLKRLDFIYQNGIMEAKDSLYLESLKNLLNRVSSHPASADVYFALASQLNGNGNKYQPLEGESYKWDRKEAVKYCDEAIQKFPETDGAKKCKILKTNILNASLELVTGEANVPEKPFLGLLTYRNTGEAFIRIVRLDDREDEKMMEPKDELKKYLKMTVENQFSVKLPNDGDFQNHTIEIKFPSLKAGKYVIIVSKDNGFPIEKNTIIFNTLWITNISCISQNTNKKSLNVYVLHREEGSALENVQIYADYREYNYRTSSWKTQTLGTYTTDKNGFAEITVPDKMLSQNNISLKFISGNDRFNPGNSFYLSQYKQERNKHLQTFFFTDRAIYRPGQTVYFKGIIIETDGTSNAIKTGQKTSVTFYDANGQNVSAQDFTSNEYGSFQGSFTTPSSGLTGNMRISNENGSTEFSVEEYKRPKFEVTFEPVKGSYKLGETVSVKGKAVAYAGNAIDNAQVSYRVVRRTHFPYWGWWCRWIRPQSPEMEITSGTAKTDENGIFTVNFTAIPEKNLSSWQKPVFDYTVTADVTDINGESHSGEKTVSVGYNALIIKLNIPENVNRKAKSGFELTTTNLNGEKEPANLEITVSQLRQPEKIFRTRNWDRPDKFVMSKEEFEASFPYDIYDNEDDITKWEKKSVKFSGKLNTEKDSLLIFPDFNRWEPGSYVAEIKTSDKFGTEVKTEKYFTVFLPESGETATNGMDWFTELKSSGEPGEKASLLLGCRDKNVNVYFETGSNSASGGQWFKLNRQQKLFEIPIQEENRGGIPVTLFFVKHNRIYQHQTIIDVPYTNKMLDFNFETFRDKLQPGQAEEWRIRIKGKKGEKVAAEMLASMYDASLDAFRPADWNFYIFNKKAFLQNWNSDDFGISNYTNIEDLENFTNIIESFVPKRYDQLNWMGINFGRSHRFVGGAKSMAAKGNDENFAVAEMMDVANEVVVDKKMNDEGNKSQPVSPKHTEQPLLRRNFNETAFFYPNLQTDENGDVLIRFTAPESLTRWKLMGLAHTKNLMNGQFSKEIVTQKELMVMPNAPRFFRESDTITFQAKISNLTSETMQGTASLEFFDAVTMQPLNLFASGTQKAQTFNAQKGQSAVAGWKLIIPIGTPAVTYRITAQSGNFSDGEENTLPVLTNHMLVTETLPMPIPGKGTYNFTMDKLLQSPPFGGTKGGGKLTLEFTSNPAWYAVQALPYLREPTYECVSNIFNCYYANSISTSLVNQNPAIKRVFDSWKNSTPSAFLSNLEKNQELKSALLEETPWVMEAASEKEQKQRIALLFDINKMSDELENSLRKLSEKQSSNGGWPWFPGMPEDEYITQYIVTGLGHLDQLGIKDMIGNTTTWNMLRNAVRFLDNVVKNDFINIKKQDTSYLENNHLDGMKIQYLYARSYFDATIPANKQQTEAITYFRQQAQKYWRQNDLCQQAMIALALHRFGDLTAAKAILRSFSEKALHSEEMGMYWRDNKAGYFWHQAPVETQALLIEAFNTINGDKKAVEEMKTWLLKQKQTQNWEGTRATAEAIYALLSTGREMLTTDNRLTIQTGKRIIEPQKLEETKVEAGTGYFKTSWNGEQVLPEMGKVTVSKADDGIAWGALYWQHFEQLDKITAQKTPLQLNKKLFVERNTPSGPVIEPVSTATHLKVGDKLKVRIELRVDRDMDYVHMKDMRASAFEPVNILSGYQYQGGLGYYESTRDASTNFFFSRLPKGTWVFEYELVVSQKGEFSNGITTIQCMYAPEFASHSEGIRVKVE